MKILHSVLSSEYLGSETGCAQLVGLQREMGHDVRVVLRDRQKNQVKRFINYMNSDVIHKIPWWLPSAMDPLYFVAELTAFSPDIVHTHLGRATRRINLASRLTNTKHVASLHMGFRKSDYYNCDGLICVAEWQKKSLINYHKPSTVIRNWFEPNYIKNNYYVGIIKKKLGIKDNDFVFGAITRLHPTKRVETSIKAFNSSFSRGECVHLVIVGEGQARRELEHVAGNKLGTQIHFMGYQELIPEWLRLFDCFISASEWEGMPLSVIEALGEGLPLILSKNDGHQEISNLQALDKINLFAVGDVSALSKFMGAAFRKGPVCMKYDLNPFSRASAGAQSIRFYEEILG